MTLQVNNCVSKLCFQVNYYPNRNLIEDIYNLKEPRLQKSLRKCWIPHKNLSSIFAVDKPYSLAVCLPPKTGSTNWRKAMNVLEMHAKNISRWNGDEFWKPSDFVWEVEERLYNELLWLADRFDLKSSIWKHSTFSIWISLSIKIALRTATVHDRLWLENEAVLRTGQRTILRRRLIEQNIQTFILFLMKSMSLTKKIWQKSLAGQKF